MKGSLTMTFQEMAEAQENGESPLSTPPLEKPPDEARGNKTKRTNLNILIYTYTHK
jgi:hypothetical protein